MEERPMHNTELSQHLILIEERLRAIEAAQSPSALMLVAQKLTALEVGLKDRVPIADVKAAIEDVFATHGLVVQLTEVYTTQRDALATHYEAIDRVLETRQELDQEVRDLLVQLRELSRRHARGLADLERAADLHEAEAERRVAPWSAGDEERRKAG